MADVGGALARLAVEYDLGELTAAEPLAGGGDQVVKLITTRGSFVVKPVYRALEWELYAVVEQTLNARGIRQARLFRTRTGDVVGSAGLAVQEFVPGEMGEPPTRARADQAMRQLAAYDEALATIDIPTELDATDNVWTRVVSPVYLVDRLPRLMETFGPAWLEPGPVCEALELLSEFAPAFAELPRQLVHGDIGPDNVLYEPGQDRVVAIIDFTPFHEPAVFGLCTALYWFHVRPAESDGVDVAAIRSGLDAYDECSPLSARERSLIVPMLLREGLRRLATPLACAEDSGGPVPEVATRRRYDALLRLLPLVRDDGFLGR
jgi:Ser/Thr protein kinase RdoA (MazF antagonist)